MADSYNSEDLERFQRDYYRYGKHDPKRQIPHLVALADYYKRKYSRTLDWTDCIKAHTLYNSVSVRQPDNESWKKKIYEIQKIFLGKRLTIGYADQERLTQRLTCKLETIRQRFREERLVAEQLVKSYDSAVVDPSVDAEFYECMKAISIDCSEMMIRFAGEIIRESVLILNECPPCDFQGIAIGSLARGEATPYSDLEYLFLIEKKTADTEAYFEKLAIASYFLMGNLRETKLSYVAIEELSWFDDQSKNGFKIDGLTMGAGNIPTGNGLKEKKNHFIVTPEELGWTFKRIHDNPTKEALRGDLTAMLTFTEVIYSHGTNDLLSALREKISRYVPNKSRKDANLTMLKTDATKFKIDRDINLRLKGNTADVKKEFYRFPSIILLDIIIALRQHSKTSWQALETLIRHGKISKDIGAALKFSMAAAVYTRLSAYLYHDSHNDRISLSDSVDQLGAVRTSVHQLWFLPASLYSRLCAKMKPLKACLSKTNLNGLSTIALPPQTKWDLFCQQHDSCRYYEALGTLREIGNGDPLDAFKGSFNIYSSKEKFHVDMVGRAMFTFTECDEMTAVIELYKLATKQLLKAKFPPPEDWTMMAAPALSDLGRFSEAINLLLTVRENSNTSTQLKMAFAEVYLAIGDYNKAEQHQLKALELECNKIFSENITESADYYGNCLSYEIDKHVDIKNLPPEDVLRIQIPSSVTTILSVRTLGTIYSHYMQVDLARSYAQRGLDLVEQLYGKGTATWLAGACLTDLGMFCTELMLYEEAEKYIKRSLAIHRKISRVGEIAVKGNQIYNLARIYLHQKRFGKAESFYNKSLAMYRKVKEQDQTQSIEFHTKAFSNKAVTNIFIFNLYRAEEQLRHSLRIMAVSSKASFYPSQKGYILYWLGSCYRMQHKYTKALQKYRKAKSIYESAWPGHSLILEIEKFLLCKPGPVNPWPAFTPNLE